MVALPRKFSVKICIPFSAIARFIGVIVTSYPSLRSARASIRARLFLALRSGSQPCSIHRTPLMQDLPNHTAEPMGDGPDGRLIAQPRQQTAEHDLKMTTFLLDGRVCRLVQHPAQIFIALGGATAVVLFSAFVFSGTGPHPR